MDRHDDVACVVVRIRMPRRVVWSRQRRRGAAGDKQLRVPLHDLRMQARPQPHGLRLLRTGVSEHMPRPRRGASEIAVPHLVRQCPDFGQPFGYSPLRHVGASFLPLAASGILEAFKMHRADAWGARIGPPAAVEVDDHAATRRWVLYACRHRTTVLVDAVVAAQVRGGLRRIAQRRRWQRRDRCRRGRLGVCLPK